MRAYSWRSAKFLILEKQVKQKNVVLTGLAPLFINCIIQINVNFKLMAKPKKDQITKSIDELHENGVILSVQKSNNNISVAIKESGQSVDLDAVEIASILEKELEIDLRIVHIKNAQIKEDYSGTPTYTILFEKILPGEVKAV